MKVDMTSFDVAAIVSEFSQTLKGARVKNIYHILPSTFLFKLQKKGYPQTQLLIEVGKRLHLTSVIHKATKKPSNFCMALRKYLRNIFLEGISQHNFDRIVNLDFSWRETSYRLVVEVFGDGNIILLDSDEKILLAFSYKKMRDRDILRGNVFQYPPPTGKKISSFTMQDFNSLGDLGPLKVVTALASKYGLGGLYAEEVLLRAKIDKNTRCDALTQKNLESIAEELTTLLSNVYSGKITPCIFVGGDSKYVDVTPFQLMKYKNFECVYYASFNEAYDEFTLRKSLDENVVKTRKKAEEELAKYNRILKEQELAIRKTERIKTWNRRVGDIIYVKLQPLQVLTHKVLLKIEAGKQHNQIEHDMLIEREKGEPSSDFFVSLDLKKKLLHVSIEDLTFPISLRRSLHAEASEYFSKAKQAEKKIVDIKKAFNTTLKKVGEIKKAASFEQKKASDEKPRKVSVKAWFEKFRWFRSSDGLLVIGGRDATQNEILVKKHVESKDIIFHSDIQGAPFVVVKTEGSPITDQTVKEAAEFAASYSKGWREGLSVIDVYWVNPSQLSKTPPSGQYLQKGAFVVRGEKTFVKNVPLCVAIGIQITEDGEVKVIGGPKDAVSKTAEKYFKIVPGDEKSSQLAKKLKKFLAKQVPEKVSQDVLKIPIEDFQRFIPSGRGRLSTR